MKKAFVCAFAGAWLIAACGPGFTKIGDGESGGEGGDPGGQAGASSGGSSSGGGSNGGACENRPCGATCARGDVAGYCDASGNCGLAFPLCEAPECETTGDCVQPGAPCQQCMDGSFACPSVECFAGQCIGSFPTCEGATCQGDQDCPQSLAPCQVCADGSAACPYSRCEGGQCVSGIDTCEDGNPCEGKSCGETCTNCPPGLACPAVVMYCDQNLQCQLNAPVCETPSCMADKDCPQVGACPMCPDGTSCAEIRCVQGTCSFQCDGGSCGAEGESCASGEACCGGLTCCSGVPVPPGEEYCGAVCPISDREMKSQFASVDPSQVLDKLVSLPISTWVYKTEASEARHIGPMAQDFMATFGVGSSDRTILQVDADGVALASIQALHARLARLEQRNAELERQVLQLQATSER
jgi:hypothetical protein